MKFRNPGRAVCPLFAASVLVFPSVALAQTKTIHLRNEIILTEPRAATSAKGPAAPLLTPATGLFLVQFEGPLASSQREELRSAGIELLKYVPEDAFIVKLSNVPPAQVSALAYVRYVGPYLPQHKIHPRLGSPGGKFWPSNEVAKVSVLVSPGASAGEIAEVRSLLRSVQYESRLRQGTIVRGELAPGQFEALSQSSAVLWIEPAPKRKLVDEQASKLVGGDDGRIATPTVTEQMGFGGTGVTVCVADTGLDTGDTNTLHPDMRGRVTGFQYYPPLTDGSDGYGHGTHCAGIVSGNAATGETDPNSGTFYGLGVASQANLFIERIFDENANEVSPPPSDEELTQDAVRGGAKIGSNSWGNDVQGEYDTDAAQFDELVRDADTGTPGDQPYILEFSAGNAGSGSQTLDSPASGKNVIATGASENVPNTGSITYGYGLLYNDGPDTVADFSSRGPCEDGRLKPDVVAPGTWISSAASAAAPNEASIAWATIDNYYVYMGGTSMSGPHAAGAAAVFVQYYQSQHTNAIPSPALVKAALINSANELDESNGGPGPVPNNDEGWGRITLTNIIVTNLNTAPRYYQYVDQTVLLSNSQVYTQHTFVHASDQPLKVTLAYTDVAGFPGALPALVNDLDLVVIGPDGTLYRGNQFGDGESVPNAPSPDKLNNVEGVYLSQPAPGDYQVQVRATKVVEDARQDTPAIDQDFALVISGDLSRPGQGMILLDRPEYTAPGQMQIEVLDAGRAGKTSVTVLVKSTSEPAGANFTLQAAGNYGAFTGVVATVVGSVPGELDIHNGDTIEADYVDASGTQRSATAVANLLPPAISNVTEAVDVGVITITWQTSEPANSIVHYGTNFLNLNLGVTNAALTTSHIVRLSKLIPGKTYYFLVSSSDEAGNSATNNNSGALFTFIGVATPTVLMVDDYEPDNASPVIGDGTYTNVLAAAGVSYGFWKVLQRGPPQLSDLQAFPVVIWRTTDDIVNYTGTNNTLTPGQQYMIETYLNGGGSFFMASMGILSQLGDVPFRQDVLQVAGFITNPDPPAPCACDEDYGVPAIVGAPGAGITSGMNMTLDYSSYPTFDDGYGDVYGPDFSDTFTPSSNATAIVFESVSGKPCGMSYPNLGVESPGRVVFLSFPFDALPTNGTAPNNAVALLRNAVNFLAPGANGVGTILLDNTVYTTNDQVIVQIGDSDLAGTGQAQAVFSSSSSSNSVTVTLLETTHPGLFEGFITLVGANPETNQLLVHNGDSLTASYYDASGNSNVVAVATIDTVPPVITQVGAVTDYTDARVSWTTSKAADSLVQYGESVLLDRSVYSGALVTNHAVTVSGLSASRTYYYQVVSRDQAGNTAEADNNGALYTFSTLQAPRPPWSDDLEGGAPGWTVVPDPTYGSDINWTLGTPNNGLQTQAHSGTNAWCSDINGDQNFFLASSYLYGPVIDLSGLTSATLTFWDVGDFSQIYEDGVLYISTNSSTPPGSLPTVEDFSGMVADDWEQETVDLTPYVGLSVQLVWYYEGVAGLGTIYGWLVDDIGITGVTSGGTIVIAKNLGQGTYTLNAVTAAGTAVLQSGTAPLVTLSNQPTGQYSVQFGNVPFYRTPAPQTNTLATGGTLSFAGTYTFSDANSNGISDDWEKHYFGVVSTNRTRLTDTDGDGMTDWAEFIAGTDPTNAASNLRFLGATVQPDQLVRVQWTVATNRLYQVQASTNGRGWTPITDWLQASNDPTMTYTTTNVSSGAHLFRVQVRP
ncbi:Fibronectin type III domain protein (modular protein) [Verrucomicrobia bacterium]|nr:Fibronectin type III domain protein (modular protein) [Verrucomicrobiota bacterium]